MTYAQGLRKGTSTCFCGGIPTPENLAELKRVGVEAIEISANLKNYFEKMDILHRAGEYAKMIEDAGLEWWSVHLPFSRGQDISLADAAQRDNILDINEKMIRACGRAGCKVAVLHPSSEPIAYGERLERLKHSRQGIIHLRQVCDQVGMKLAVEDLPRTCLCNQSNEMLTLLAGTGAGVVFDTNHSLSEDNLHYMNAILAGGLEILSLHISDYDFVDERHRLPGDGINDWKGILSILEKAGYAGPLMYEVPRRPKDREDITFDQLGENMRALAAGEI